MIVAQPISPEDFAPFGDVIEAAGQPDRIINQGLCGRWHDLARVDFSEGRAGISVFRAKPRALPYRIEMMERHPAGSQAFVPMSLTSFLVTVAHDQGDRPGLPRAFTTAPGQGINLHRGTWHGVLTPLHAPGLFAVIDRIGPGANLEEHWFDVPFRVVGPEGL
ncbi:ureidoglycolate lyase [Rhodobacteraceae bacterium CCMM004]|nr:ureidoglycolate lyase [Rhodobacteraceae bacterium CCMM004]